MKDTFDIREWLLERKSSRIITEDGENYFMSGNIDLVLLDDAINLLRKIERINKHIPKEDLHSAIENIARLYSTATSNTVMKELNYTGKDVTKAPIIGKVLAARIGPYPQKEYDVVEILEDDNGNKYYVTNQWYKENRVPLVIHSDLVVKYTPTVKEDIPTDYPDDDPDRTIK